jgi:dipeptidase E
MATDDRKRILLLSSSTVFGSGPFDHAKAEIEDFLQGIGEILFVPFALADCASYFERTRDRLRKMGFEVSSLHGAADKSKSVAAAQAIFVGGGNTFRLLKTLYDLDLLEPIREQVRAGTPYMGSSAGSNIAGPTIRTTNDMPIVQPPSFEALGLVPFQINPHYLDADPESKHMGETREERITQFLEENDTPVVGLREGAILRVEKGKTRLAGATGARVFRKGMEPVELVPGEFLDLGSL